MRFRLNAQAHGPHVCANARPHGPSRLATHVRSRGFATVVNRGRKTTLQRRLEVRFLCFADGIAYLECRTADAETVHRGKS